jgi:hypothetical protein
VPTLVLEVGVKAITALLLDEPNAGVGSALKAARAAWPNAFVQACDAADAAGYSMTTTTTTTTTTSGRRGGVVGSPLDYPGDREVASSLGNVDDDDDDDVDADRWLDDAPPSQQQQLPTVVSDAVAHSTQDSMSSTAGVSSAVRRRRVARASSLPWSTRRVQRCDYVLAQVLKHGVRLAAALLVKDAVNTSPRDAELLLQVFFFARDRKTKN